MDISLRNFARSNVSGFTGSKGDLGYTGSQGNIGYVGSHGDSGYTGSQGNIGYVGSQGDVGYIGSTGYTGSGGKPNNWTVQTANFTASNGDRIIANTSAGSFYITLPSSPSTGNSVTVTDGANFASNSVFVLRNGSTIESAANDIEIDLANVTVELLYDGTTWQIISTAGPRGYAGSKGNPGAGGYTTYTITTNTQTVANSRYIINTNTSNITVTLPAGPSVGDEVSIIDGTGNASVHAITVDRNSNKIQGIAENLVIQTNRAAFSLVYYDSQNGWVLTDV